MSRTVISALLISLVVLLLEVSSPACNVSTWLIGNPIWVSEITKTSPIGYANLHYKNPTTLQDAETALFSISATDYDLLLVLYGDCIPPENPALINVGVELAPGKPDWECTPENAGSMDDGGLVSTFWPSTEPIHGIEIKVTVYEKSKYGIGDVPVTQDWPSELLTFKVGVKLEGYSAPQN